MKNPFVSHYIAFLDVGLYKYYVYFLNIIKPFRLIIEIRHGFTFSSSITKNWSIACQVPQTLTYFSTYFSLSISRKYRYTKIVLIFHLRQAVFVYSIKISPIITCSLHVTGRISKPKLINSRLLLNRSTDYLIPIIDINALCTSSINDSIYLNKTSGFYYSFDIIHF